MDVAEGQAAEHHVERLGRKGEIPGISIRELDTVADPSTTELRAAAARLFPVW
jgi:hypothetical protein